MSSPNQKDSSTFSPRAWRHRLPLTAPLLLMQLIELSLIPFAQAESLGFSYLQRASSQQLEVSIHDDVTGLPLDGAQVWITDGFGTTHQDPPVLAYLESGEAPSALPLGDIQTDPPSFLLNPRVITVFKEGYQRFSLVGVQTGQIAVYLKPLRNTLGASTQLTGELRDWEMPSSGFLGAKTIAAGIVFPVLSANDLMRFDPSLLISPERDTIDVMGPRRIPSNFVLPPQDVAVSIVPIHLEKPAYRLPVRPLLPLQLTGIQGEIGVSDITNGLGGSGKISLEILNKVKMKKLGTSTLLTPPQSGQLRTDLRAPVKLSQRHSVRVSQVPFPADVLVAAVSDLDDKLEAMVPTDLKLAISRESGATSGSQVLVGPTRPIGKAEHLIAIALSEDYRNLSCIIAARVANSNPSLKQTSLGSTTEFNQFLTPHSLTDAPELPESLEVSTLRQSLTFLTIEADSPEWIIGILPSTGSLRIPTRKFATTQPPKGLSLYQLDFGPAFDENLIDHRTQLTQVKRLTRSHAKIGAQPPTPAFTASESNAETN